MVYLFIIFFSVFSSSEINKKEIIDDYNKANTVITAKLTDIRQVGDLGLFCEFEAIQIFKGKVLKTYLVKVQENKYKKGNKFLLYLKKDRNKKIIIYKSKTKKNNTNINEEIDFLYSYVDNKLFRRVKTPGEVKYLCGGG